MTATIYLLTICLPLATVLIVFGMKYRSANQQAQVRLAGEEAYQQLAAKVLSTQADTARSLSAIEAALSDARTRIAAIEDILKTVE